LVLYFIALFISFSNSEENVPTVSTLSQHSQKVVEAVEILQTENKELKMKVKQLENNAEKNAYLLRELKDAVDALRKGMTNVEEVTRQVDLSKLVVRLILSEAYGIVENNELEDYEIPLRQLTTSKWYSKVDCHFGGIEVALWRSNLALLERNETVDNSKRVLILSRILSSDNYKEETDLVVKSKRCYRVVIFMYEKTVEESSHLYFVYSSKSEEDFETNIFPHTWNNDFKKI
jgi:FtsZ-binding cell division protein ZapB